MVASSECKNEDEPSVTQNEGQEEMQQEVNPSLDRNV